MWKVLEARGIEKQLRRAPKEIKAKYEFWRNVVELDGPMGLRKLSGFRDHSLQGEWKGSRSSYLSKQWRVIYTVRAEELEILVLEVNPHDYRKKG